MKMRGMLLAGLLAAVPCFGADVLTVAVFDFESKDEGLRDAGPKVATLVNALLSADARLITVERAELDKILSEQELGLSGTVSTETAAKVGKLTGAKVLVTGRVFTAGREQMAVAKIIGTETSRVYGEISKNGAGGSIADLANELAPRIAKTIEAKADTLVAKAEKMDDLVARLQKEYAGKKFPTVVVSVPERHIGAPTIDPAVQTEIGFILQKLGATVLDPKEAARADIEINGEAFSELGLRKGNLVSCKARVELKVRDRASGNLIFIDRQTTVAIDVAEHLAGKTALQEAGAKLAERLLPALLK